MFDSFNRRIDYLRISVTDRCNLRCRYCMPAEGIPLKSHDDILSYERIARIATAAVELGIHKIRLTGGEPLVRKGISALVAQLRPIPGLQELTLTTNGLLLPPLAAALRDAGLDRINISLDTLDAGKYAFITRGGDVRQALAGIVAAREAGFTRTKINMVVMPEFNEEEVPAMMRFCRENDLELQRIRHYSLSAGLAAALPMEAERPQPCNVCNRLRLTADGKLKPCLFSDIELAVDYEHISASILAAVHAKPQNGHCCTRRENWQIGG